MQAETSPTGAPTIRAGLVGRGIQRSRTPAMHAAEGAAQGLDYRYALLDLDREAADMPALVARAQREGYAGLNITFPCKVEVIALLDELSDNARALGAVNTVVFRDGRRRGHNTDLWGFSESFARGMGDAPRGQVLLLGAGGAGMAVGHALAALGTERLWIHDVERGRAEALAEALAARHGPDRARAVDAAAGVEAVAGALDGLVNATPVGMEKLPGCPFPKALLRPEMWVADIIYFPLETELLAAARAAGCRVLPGSGMAVFQAVRSFELFTGLSPDAERLRATFESLGP